MGANGAFHEECPPRRAVDNNGEESFSNFGGDLVEPCSLEPLASCRPSISPNMFCVRQATAEISETATLVMRQKQLSPRFRSECPEIGVPTANVP
jgi:hypothetical protein